MSNVFPGNVSILKSLKDCQLSHRSISLVVSFFSCILLGILFHFSFGNVNNRELSGFLARKSTIVDFVLPVFEKYQDDKKGHSSYSLMYSKYLRSIQNSKISLLEIGVGCVNEHSYLKGHEYTPGRSYQVWKEILSDADIFVIDIDKCALQLTELGLSQDSIFVGSQTDPAILSKTVQKGGPFDVIIDDGSHKPEHQISTFAYLFDKGLQPGGIYVIEDLESSVRRANPLEEGTTFLMLAEASILLTHNSFIGRKVVPGASQIKNGFLLSSNVTGMIESIEWFEDAVVISKKA